MNERKRKGDEKDDGERKEWDACKEGKGKDEEGKGKKRKRERKEDKGEEGKGGWKRR